MSLDYGDLTGLPSLAGATSWVYNATAGTLVNAGSANVGINNANPTCPLDVTGLIRGTQFAATSDARVKCDVLPVAHERCMGTVRALRVRDFCFRVAPSVRHTGLIAQEVEAVEPRLVSLSAAMLELPIPLQAQLHAQNVVLCPGHDVRVGQLVRLQVGGAAVHDVQVTGVSGDAFRLAHARWNVPAGRHLPGRLVARQVDDMRSLEVTQLLAVALGALQDADARIRALEAAADAAEAARLTPPPSPPPPEPDA